MRICRTLLLALLLGGYSHAQDTFRGADGMLLEDHDAKYLDGRGGGLYDADHQQKDGEGNLESVSGVTSGGWSYENSQDMDGMQSIVGIVSRSGGSADDPYVRVLVATDDADSSDTVYYGWQLQTDDGTEYATLNWYHGAATIDSMTAVDVTSHNILLAEAHELRSVLTYNSSTELKVDAYVDDVLVDTLYVESGQGAVASWGGAQLDSGVEFFGSASGRYPGVLWYDKDNSNVETLFTSWDDGVSFVEDEDWSYIGIPYTDWEYDPADIEVILPASWSGGSTSATAGYYFVEPDHASATDSGNAYGHPDLPRATMPATSAFGDTFGPGTVIYMKGSGFDAAAFGGRSDWNPEFQGTAVNPVFIVGDSGDPPVISGVQMRTIDSYYVVFDGIHWVSGNLTNTVLSLSRSDRYYDTHHVTIKNCLFEDLDYISGGAGIVTASGPQDGGTDYYVHDVLFYNNVIKDCGKGFDWTASDGDQHGFHPAARAYRLWVIGNDVQRGDVADPIDDVRKAISGNLLQVGGNANDRTKLHHVYAAGNTGLDGGMRQGLLWTKNSSYVIFSENHCDRLGENYQADNGQSYGTQYDAEHHWFIFNVSEDARAGWMHTDNGGQRTGPHVIYGNTFINLNSDGDNAVNSFERGGVSLWNTQNDTYIVNNTFYNIENGVSMNAISSTATMYVKDNIFSHFQGTEQMQFDIGTITGALELENNILYTAGTIDAVIGGTSYSTIAGINGRSDSSGNIEADPNFVNAPTDLNVSSGSDAIDGASGTTDIPALFVTTFSSDDDYPGTPNIDFDISGAARDQGAGVDIGAYEFTASGSTPTAPSGLGATAVSSSQINLSWTDNADDETGFKIERSTTSGSGFSQIDTAAANATTYNDTGLSAETTYYYQVRAYNGAGNSSYTSEASDTTDAESSPASTSQKLNTGAINLLQ